MSAIKASTVYKDHIRSLPVSVRLELLALIARDLAYEAQEFDERPRHSILEFYGVGKGSRGDEDAQAYINRLRDGWEEPSP